MTKKTKGSAPIVFISSTVEDLEPFRERAKEAALAVGFYPRMMEYFPVSGRPSVPECRKMVASSQLLIAIVAHRYGWVPSGQPKGEYKSITWLECLEAVVKDLTVLAFVVDEKADDWPEHLYEDYRLREVSRNRKATQKEAVKAFQLVQKNNAALSEFKDWLKERHCGF